MKCKAYFLGKTRKVSPVVCCNCLESGNINSTSETIFRSRTVIINNFVFIINVICDRCTMYTLYLVLRTNIDCDILRDCLNL